MRSISFPKMLPQKTTRSNKLLITYTECAIRGNSLENTQNVLSEFNPSLFDKIALNSSLGDVFRTLKPRKGQRWVGSKDAANSSLLNPTDNVCNQNIPRTTEITHYVFKFPMTGQGRAGQGKERKACHFHGSSISHLLVKKLETSLYKKSLYKALLDKSASIWMTLHVGVWDMAYILFGSNMEIWVSNLFQTFFPDMPCMKRVYKDK